MITLASILAFMAPAMFKPADKSFEKDNGWVKPDPRSLDAFIAWLKTKPASQEYYWPDPEGCAMGQYRAYLRKDLGILDEYMPCALLLTSGPNSYYVSCNRTPWTFGAALKRAEKYKKAHNL